MTTNGLSAVADIGDGGSIGNTVGCENGRECMDADKGGVNTGGGSVGQGELGKVRGEGGVLAGNSSEMRIRSDMESRVA